MLIINTLLPISSFRANKMKFVLFKYRLFAFSLPGQVCSSSKVCSMHESCLSQTCKPVNIIH